VKRKRTHAVSREGVRHVGAIVEANNSIFQEIDSSNDVGNDAYIEFVDDESTTGCCIAVQIKSGVSYFNRAGRPCIRVDASHIEYWRSHTLPVAGVVYDPRERVAYWCDITASISEERSARTQISIDQASVFSTATFGAFMTHFKGYRDSYSREANLGRALRAFADTSDVEHCWDGLRSLFSFHRNEKAAWFYVVNAIRVFRHHDLLPEMVSILRYVPGHGDLFLGDWNFIDRDVREFALQAMRASFGRTEIATLLSAVDDENGFSRGSVGQDVMAIVNVIPAREDHLDAIAFDRTEQETVRVVALQLMTFDPFLYPVAIVNILRRYLTVFPQSHSAPFVRELIQYTESGGPFDVY
jgi:hypothetical protein